MTATAPRRVVIVGAGLAAVHAAAGLRALGFDGSLTVIGDEPRRPYDRPPLSKQVLTAPDVPDMSLPPTRGSPGPSGHPPSRSTASGARW